MNAQPQREDFLPCRCSQASQEDPPLCDGCLDYADADEQHMRDSDAEDERCWAVKVRCRRGGFDWCPMRSDYGDCDCKLYLERRMSMLCAACKAFSLDLNRWLSAQD